MNTNNTYAVVATGGKQYKVSEGCKFKVEKLEVEVGQTVSLDRILLVSANGQITVGAPTIAGAAVTAKVVAHEKDEKKIIFHKRIRKGFKRKKGHRQVHTVLLVESIKA